MLSNIKFRMTRVIVDRSVMTGTNGMRIPNTRLHHGNFLRDLVISEREREREYIFNRRSTIVQDLQQGLLGAFGAFLLIAVHILQDACSMHSRCQTQHALYMSCYTVEVSMHRQAIASIHQSWYIYIVGLRPLVKLLSTVNFHRTPLIDSSYKNVAFAGPKSNTPLRAAWLNQNEPCNITGFQHLKNMSVSWRSCTLLLISSSHGPLVLSLSFNFQEYCWLWTNSVYNSGCPVSWNSWGHCPNCQNDLSLRSPWQPNHFHTPSDRSWH